MLMDKVAKNVSYSKINTSTYTKNFPLLVYSSGQRLRSYVYDVRQLVVAVVRQLVVMLTDLTYG